MGKAKKPKDWREDPKAVKEALERWKGNLTGLAREMGVRPETLRNYCHQNKKVIDLDGIRQKYANVKEVDFSAIKGPQESSVFTESAEDEAILAALQARKSTSLIELCDIVGLPPTPVLTAIKRLHAAGYRIPSQEEVMRYGHVSIKTTDSEPYEGSGEEFDIDFEGDTYICATVSDTHLSSTHEHPEYLEAAYDMIEELGITDVYHGGDLSCGMGIYKGQINEVKHVRIDDQTQHAVKTYPKRAGIVNRIIAGNHDIEGVAGRIGVNPLKSFCAQREDFEYLGEYTAWLNLPNGARVHMIHPMGGGSYAISYRPQKHVESYTEAEKPDILWIAHYHKAAYFPAPSMRGINTFLLGTFEGQSMLAVRRALGEPGLGFWIHKIVMKPRGIVQYQPTWFDFLDGVPDLMAVA